MVCEQCRQEPATVYFTRVVDGQKEERHLCEGCARESGMADFMLEPTFSIQHLIAGLMGAPASSRTSLGQAVRRCDVCGLDMGGFSKTGRLGCPHCYETFAAPLKPLIRRIHGDVEHTGKVPQRAGERAAVEQQLRGLKRELEEAVAAEAYERAAELRDQIRQVEAANGQGH